MATEKDIAYRLKCIRETLGLKQKDFAEKLKISGPTLSELEKGKYKPGYELFFNISKEFDVNLNFLLFGEGEMFLDAIKETASRLESFAVNNEEVRKFLHYFERSKILQFRILSYFNTILLEEQPIIEKEIESKKYPGNV